MSPAPWVEKWLGIPYVAGGRTREGFDCWGLVRAVLAQDFGIIVPAFDTTAGDLAEVTKTMHGEAARSEWIDVAAPGVREGDVLLFRILGVPSHVGICCGDGFFLHTYVGLPVSVGRYFSPEWERRIVSFKRHRHLACN